MHSQTIKATLTETGQIIPQEPLNLPPGEIEILILTNDPTPSPQPIQYRTQAFKELLQQAPPFPTNFDPEQTKWEYLQQKYNLTPSQNHPPESLRQQALNNGYDTREKILNLIQKVKHEIIVSKGWVKP